MNLKRIRFLKNKKFTKGPIVYWMSRDQRIRDNWAFIYAQLQSIKQKEPLIVVFNLQDNFLEAGLRHFEFMLRGLEEVSSQLEKLEIPFILLQGKVEDNIPNFIMENNIGLVISDFSPLKISKQWKSTISNNIEIPFVEVDAHNIVPCWVASTKQEYSARTIRPKIHKALDEFFDPFPYIFPQKHEWHENLDLINWEKILKSLNIDQKVKPVNWIKPGEKNAFTILESFIDNKINKYESERNDPNIDTVSNLSPYLHYGQISAQRVALEITRSNHIQKSAKDVFIEELIVRRELAENYCNFNENYDSFSGFHNWAQTTLNDHRMDPREYIYSQNELELGKTHDELWNAAQVQMVNSGKMHGYMRMYWAKKILEWSETPEMAQHVAIYLNDKYELDGRDPNGYTGIAWSIGGVHDRPWGPERPIFGKVRYMNYNGAKRKFKVTNFVAKHLKHQKKLNL